MSAVERSFLPLKEVFFPEKYVYSKFSASLTRLIAIVCLETIKALQARKYRYFDANPGDGGCQNRAFALRRIVRVDLTEECQDLARIMLQVPQQITPAQLKDPSFFDQYIGDAEISSEMGYFLLCYFLTFLKKVDAVQQSGVILTKTDQSRMRFLHPRQHIRYMQAEGDAEVCWAGPANSFPPFS